MAHLNIPGISPELASTVVSILMEVARAEKKHPNWTNDIIRQIAFVTEESGELTRAGNLLEEGKGSFAEIRTEAIETACTAIRLLTKLRVTEESFNTNYIFPIEFEPLTDDHIVMIRKEFENE